MHKKPFRRPHNFDGTGLTSHHLGKLLTGALSELGNVYQEKPDLILALWPEIIGPKLARMTQAVSFTNGVLFVTVMNSTLFSLLNQYEKPKILSDLRKKLPRANIVNIVFRIG